MRPAEFTDLIYEVRSGVAWLTMNRPARRNALTPDLYNEIRWAVRAANLDTTVDVIVLTGAGGTFSAGGDLKDALERFDSGGVLNLYAFFDNAPFFELRDTPKTVIAAIQGSCYAGGLIAAAHCDLAIAAESARFALTEAKVGLADAFAPTILFGRTPAPKLKYLLFTGASISAAEAVDYGLIGESVPDDEFDDRVAELIREVQSTSPASRAMYKQFMNELVPRPAGNGGVEVYHSPAAREGLVAFQEKRRADYSGESAPD